MSSSQLQACTIIPCVAQSHPEPRNLRIVVADPEDRSLIIQQQRRMDLHIIRCIDQAIKNNRPGRALDLATYLTAVKSIDGSIKLAAHRKVAPSSVS